MVPAEELYVYYKLRAERADAALIAFEAARGAAPPQSLRLLQRREAGSTELLTWMEIYAGEPAAAAALEQRVAAALVGYLEGPRHLERFMPLLAR